VNAELETQPRSATGPSGPKPPWFPAWIVCSVLSMTGHALLVEHFVPVKEVFSERPLQGIDYDLHIGQVFRVVEALDRWGKAWLYDVHLLAGQPEGAITDSGSKGWELWTFALFRLGVPRPIAFNSFVLFVMLAAPLVLFRAARSFGLGHWESLLAAAMSSTLWFFDSHLHWVWFVGMISWSGASCLALLTLGLFYRFLHTLTLARACLCALCLGTVLLIHPYTFFVLTPPMLALYARAFRSLPRRGHILISGIALSAVAENAFWLHNAIKHWHYILDSAYYAQARPEYLLCDYFDVLCNGADSGVIGTRTGFRILYLALAVAGLVVWKRQRDERWLPFVTGLLTLLAIAYFGGFIPHMQQTQPYRQITPAMLMTTLPAASFVGRFWAQRDQLLPALASRAMALALVFALVQQLLATQVAYFLPELVPTPKDHPDGARSPLSGYGHLWHPDFPAHFRYSVPHDPALIEYGFEPTIRWLQVHTRPSERVLIEGSVLGERVAWRTNLEVLGGFFERNVTHVDANYFREHRTYAATPLQLAHYLRTYAVDWVISNRPEFARVPELLRAEALVGALHVYRTRIPVNRVLHGGGAVRASENRIEVSGSDPSEVLLLAYHWHEALRCKPECRVERQVVDIDRVGFIRIPAPHAARVVVWNSYQSW
jgi:hypothetical protein